jgi:hypothetical protein
MPITLPDLDDSSMTKRFAGISEGVRIPAIDLSYDDLVIIM